MEQTIRQKIGQLIFAGFPSLSAGGQAEELVKRFHVGNFVYFSRNLATARQAAELGRDLSAMVQGYTRSMPLLAVDQEGGAVTRLRDGAALFPGSMAMAASPGADVYRTAKNCAKVLRSVGISVNFAPVLDISLSPLSTVIGARSFGDDVLKVARFGIAMMHGFQDGGVLSAVKHFPGHGGVQEDTHHSIPVNSTPSAILENTEWKPFKLAFDAGAEALMTTHVCYSAEDTLPATLSPRIMTNLLRGRFEFKGLIITDCLEMGAIKESFGFGQGAVMAFLAGCDMLVFSHTIEAVEEAVDALYVAVTCGLISEKRIEESYSRVMAVKQRYALESPMNIDPVAAAVAAADKEARILSGNIARNSITLISDNGGLGSLKQAKNPCFLSPLPLAQTGAEDSLKARFCFAHMAAACFGGRAMELPLDGDPSEIIKEICNGAHDILVLGLYNARFRQGQIKTLRVLEDSGLPLIVVLLGAPYDAALVYKPAALIVAYEYTPLSVNALIETLGNGRFYGRLPVSILPAPGTAVKTGPLML